MTAMTVCSIASLDKPSADYLRQLFARKGDRAAFFAPKLDWSPRNEQTALALGKAQIGVRLADDAGLSVLRVTVRGETAILHLDRAPPQDMVRGAHQALLGEVGRALLGEGEHAVLVEWPL